jgi:Protein of unknown function (DUF3568)
MRPKSYFSPAFARLRFATLVTTAALLTASGCESIVTPVAGGGVVTYAYRDLDTTVAEDFNKVVESSRRTVKDLEFIKISDNKDAFAAVLVARTALDKKVVITVTNSGKNLTNIKIRVGLVGDQALSMSILDKIKAGF